MAKSKLPGVKAEIVDGQLRPRFVPQQPKVTLIGVTNNANVDPSEPTLIETDADVALVDNYFADAAATTPNPTGLVRKPSELSKAIAEARGGGAENVEFVVLPDPTAIGVKLEINPIHQRRFDALTALYTDLKETQVDIVNPVGTVIDATGIQTTQNFGYQLADFCHQSTVNEQTVIGTIGVSPPIAGDQVPTLAQLEAWVAGLESFDTSGQLGTAFPIGDGVTDSGGDGVPDTYAFWGTNNSQIPTGQPPRFHGQVEIDQRGEPVDIGKYISVCADTVRFVNEVANQVSPATGYYHNSMAAAYAGMISSLPSRVGTTNKVLGGALPVRKLSPSQVARLQEKRYVAMRMRPKGFVVSKGVTWAYNISTTFRSDFTQLTTMRITGDAISLVRLRAIEYIGGPSSAEVVNALDSDIDEALRSMQRSGALNRYDYALQINPAQAVLGAMTIELTLVPAFELTDITLVVALAKE